MLKPGGRFAIADIVLHGPPALVSEAVRGLPACGCVATALEENAYFKAIRAAGFDSIEVVDERPALSQPLHELVRARAMTLTGRK